LIKTDAVKGAIFDTDGSDFPIFSLECSVNTNKEIVGFTGQAILTVGSHATIRV